MSTSKLFVVDSIMGAGKSTWAIQKMNQDSGPWLYITPYLDEVTRIIESCPNAGFIQPQENTDCNKSDDLYRLASEGCNIASTHNLFKRLDPDTLEQFQKHGYRLIVDEVIDVIQPLVITPADRRALFTKDVLKEEVDEKAPDSPVKKVVPGLEADLDGLYVKLQGKHTKVGIFREWAESDRLVLVNETMLMWLFPSNCFEAFKEVYNLTYLFDGSYTKAYYDIHGMAYEYFSVISMDGQYRLVPYDPEHDLARRAQIRELITIHDGKLNDIGEPHHSLSFTWWGKSKPGKEAQMAKRLHAYFRRHVAGGVDQTMWTCFKENYAGLKGKGYTGGWIPHNQRATNAYRKKSNLAYCVNRFMNTMIGTYFSSFNFQLDEEAFALSELLQWLWRSRIRDGQSVNLFLPSQRMRSLLLTWLSCFPEPLTTIEPV